VKGESVMKRNFLLYVLGILLIAMPCCSKSENSTAPAKPAGIVAAVGSESVTSEDLSHALNTMPREQQFEYLSEDGKRVLIEILIDWKLLAQEAVKAGLEKDEAVKAALKNTSGSTGEREEVLGSAYLLQRIKQLPAVTDEQIKQYYLSHPAEFAQPARIRVQRIIFDSREQAQQALPAITQGATFEQYKQQHQQSKIKVDTLWLQQRDNATDMESAAFKLSGSQLSDILPVSTGFCLVRVEERLPAGNRSLEAVSASLKAMLRSQQEQELITGIKACLRKGKTITVNESALANYRCAECEGRTQPAAAAPQSGLQPQTQRKAAP
jgi:peptidyl-prolyl cis-trans isomerase C